jgi:hypothetical protein
MRLTKELVNALGQAEKLLAERDQIAAAIVEAEDAMLPAIEAVVQHVDRLKMEEADRALGREPSNASRDHSDPRAKLADLTRRIAGLKDQLASLEIRFGAVRLALEPHLPDFFAAIEESFAKEWDIRSREWSEFLAKRAEIERLTGRVMNLSLPKAQAKLDGEVIRVGTVRDELAKAISELGAARAAAARDRQAKIAFDPCAVYEIRLPAMYAGRAFRGGERVVAGNIGASALAYLLKRRTAVLVSESLAAAG